jgi:two-component system cell cycle sensor histidine kinase PleC
MHVHQQGLAVKDITLSAETEPPAKSDRWRWLLHESPAAMLVTDGENVLFANRAAAEVLRYASPAELAGRTMWDLNVPEDYPVVRERIARLRRREHLPLREARLRCADGKVKRVEVAGYPIEYEGRDAVFVRLTDVTAARSRETAEREARERLALAIDMIGGATWVYDYASGRLMEHEGLLRLLGYDAEREVPSILDLVHPDDRESVRGRLSLKRPSDVWEISNEHRLRRVDGTYIWVRSRARIIADETGEPRRALGIDTDITAEKRERILRDGRATALSAITTGVPLESVLRQVVLTAEQAIDGCVAAVLCVDEGALRLVSGPHLPAPLRDHLQTLPVGEAGGCAGTAAAEARRVIYEGAGADSDVPPIATPAMQAGVRAAWIEPIVSALDHVLGVLSIYLPQPSAPRAADEMVLRELSDVARLAIEHAHTQQNLREARAEAERANRAKSHFLATMSHELRTPLNAVIGFAEIMQHGVFGPIGNHRYEAYARDIVSSARHLLDILSDILDMSRIEAGRWEVDPEPVSASDISGFSHLLSAVAQQHGCALHLDIAEDFAALADLRALKQILINLTSNAARYGKSGGPVRVVGWMQGDSAILEVQDEGPGIAAEEIEKLLQPFERSERAKASVKGGIGLGLPIVRKLAELQGAEFTLESEVDVGTQARLTFVAAAPNGGASETYAAERGEA